MVHPRVRTVLLLLSGVFLFPILLSAQPTISYIIPDIGAAGMNTYVEIIAPVGLPGSFDPGLGQSGILPLSALEIELVNPLDSNRVVISPGAVSWDGRLIGCQFFVNPDATPGPVPIRVRVNSDRSNVDTFFIVTPQAMPLGTNGGVLGSGGQWGTRSKRGAMIVDSLVLGNGSYTVARTDPDPATAGNQGYLPAVIISRGPVRMNNGTRFNVDAVGKDGGPGGGGGGGYGSGIPFPPIPGERDTPLGSGFTGGKSDIPLIGSPASSFGTGSGANSNSLNGVEANDQFTTTFPTLARLYGAGPGHPFDRDGRGGGGAAAASGGGINSFGIYYGGGGNGTAGTGLPVNQNAVSGQIVGNRQIVPLHGGGGGSSGGTNDSVGAGGGGGLSLYSQIGAVVPNTSARGSNGANGCDGCGFGSGDASGGGAAGSIIVGGKDGVQLGTVDLRGGAAGTTAPGAPVGSTSGNGGVGRFRFDGRIARGTLNPTAGASVWTGPTIDTLTEITTPLFKLRGTGRYDVSEQTNIQIFVRGEDTPWSPSIAGPTTVIVKSDSTWEADIALNTTDSIVYIFAVQVVSPNERNNTDSATRIPSVIFSQAAANILRYYPSPDIGYTPSEHNDTVLCLDERVLFDTIIVRNNGIGPLNILQGSVRFAPGASTVYSFEKNNADGGDVQLLNGEFDTIIVRVDVDPSVPGEERATLEIYSNDPDEPVVMIPFLLVKAYDSWFETNPPVGTPIDFGNVLVGTSATRNAIFKNTGAVDGVNIVVDSIWIDPATPGVTIQSQSVPNGTPIVGGDSLIAELVYQPADIDTLQGVTYCVRLAEPCDTTICWTVNGRGVKSDVTLSKPSFTLIAPPCFTGTEIFDTIRVGNGGNSPFSLTGGTIQSGPFTLVSPTFPPNRTVNPGEEVEVIVRYAPGSGGDENGSLRLTTDDPGAPEIDLDILGRSTPVRLDVPIDSLYLGTFCTDIDRDSTITLLNSGAIADTVTYRLARGVEFSIVNSAGLIEPGETGDVEIRFNAPANGLFTDTLFIVSEPCGLRDTILLAGEVATPNYRIQPNPLDFGTLQVGSSRQISATIDNSGSNIPLRVSGAQVVTTDTELQISGVTFPINVPANGNDLVRLEWRPSTIRQIPAGSFLEVYIDLPCPDTIRIPIRGESSEGGITARPSPFDFGAVLNCVSVTDTIWIRNHGNDPNDGVRLVELWLDPNDVEMTALLADPSDPMPPIPAGDSVGVEVTFAPVTGPDGPRATTLYVRTNSLLFDTIRVPLSGVRFSESMSIAGPAFTPTFPGGTDQQTLTITNDGTSPIAINQLNLPPPFRRVATRPALPTILVQGADLEIDVEFAPSDTGTFVDSIYVDGLVSCDSIFLPLAATAITPDLVRARWLDRMGEPGEVILIPLDLQSDVTGMGITGIEADVSYNETMLFPEGIEFPAPIATTWSVTSFTPSRGSVQFSATGAELTGSGAILFLRARVLLGDQTTTPVRSSDAVRFTSGAARLAIDTGQFTLDGYCFIGSDRLVRVTGDFGIKSVAPNPVDGPLQIDFETVEDGPTKLELFDLFGRKIITYVDEHLSSRAYSAEDQTALPTGTYMVVLTTRTDRDVRFVVVE